MRECPTCKTKFNNQITKTCRNCGAEYCEECSIKTKNICPACYHDLEFTD